MCVSYISNAGWTNTFFILFMQYFNNIEAKGNKKKMQTITKWERRTAVWIVIYDFRYFSLDLSLVVAD